jgi:hypothetical protein
MNKNKSRKMKVYSQSGYNYQERPAIILKGRWLEEAGFPTNSHITVETIEEGVLKITRQTE